MRRPFLSTLLVLLAIAGGEAGCLGPVDLVLPGRDKVLLFRRSPWMAAVVNAPGFVTPATLDSLPWIRPSRPEGAFAPVQVEWGEGGNFLVLDAGGGRIWQYDTAFIPVSSLALPEELLRRGVADLRLAASGGGRYVFFDLHDGLVLEYAESRGTLIAGATARLPAGTADCRLDWRCPAGMAKPKYGYLCRSTAGDLFGLGPAYARVPGIPPPDCGDPVPDALDRGGGVVFRAGGGWWRHDPGRAEICPVEGLSP